MAKDIRQEIALFRYSLIAPLVTNTYTQDTAKEYLEEVCARVYTLPDGKKREYAPATVKDWLRLYRKHGIDGLYPKIRSDKGKSCKLYNEAKQFILECKSASPKRSAKSIYQELIAKGLFRCDDISLSTVQRFISKANLHTDDSDSGIERRAFEFEHPGDCWQSDATVGPYLTINSRKHKTYIIAFLDDTSRVICSCKAFFKCTMLNLTKFINTKSKHDNIFLYRTERKVNKDSTMVFLLILSPKIVIPNTTSNPKVLNRG